MTSDQRTRPIYQHLLHALYNNSFFFSLFERLDFRQRPVTPPCTLEYIFGVWTFLVVFCETRTRGYIWVFEAISFGMH
ncbi:hypothetical protein COCC4DRAFT_167648 [Bipolaris maydis ATCC 48331]|uniref:Uncharacterized protein n=1 Tax=Cochliobolus heterostrophus (strain C4 / ATCC 48331 / race T) TaxID=665024 RepID=N4XBQ3_COCH4|nr:uncharacterized protein COCC4DRAFT_167648 [Bipolaris maydis ATCC 48331]ENI05978.1 hypothetical protein COCC4DRAFT_167648 [Bipolaris maydis ATCC 48331]